MQRRDLLKMIMATTGVAMVGGNAIAYEMGSQVPLSKTLFNKDDLMLFNEVADVIIPRTDTPGAKDVNVGQMALVLANDCYTDAEREAFVKGFKSINTLTQKHYNKPFLLLTSGQKSEFLTQLDDEAKAYNTKNSLHYLSSAPYDRNRSEDAATPHFFTLIKQLTLFAFFTSNEAATKVFRFDPVPGKYVGDLPYKKGDKAWATS